MSIESTGTSQGRVERLGKIGSAVNGIRLVRRGCGCGEQSSDKSRHNNDVGVRGETV